MTWARAIGILGILGALAPARAAHAQDPGDSEIASTLAPPTAPPPLDIPYVQYGVAFTTEFATSAGKICGSPDPCILGSGGGLAVRLGRRAAGPWYFGGAYELSKQDASSLYRFATLQQVRAEARWYLSTGYVTQPYGTFGLGVAAYGNEWGIDTYGPAAYVGIGVEAQLSRRTVVGLSLSYRLIGLRSFVDTSGAERQAGVAQFVGIDLALEARDPLSREVGR